MKRILVVIATIGLFTAAAFAWHEAGHVYATNMALKLLEGKMPAFFTSGGAAVTEVVGDPDMFTRPVASYALYSSEAPEHYFDIEPLGGAAPPDCRCDFLELLADKKLKPAKVGMLPYAIVEWTQKLAIALAEHRKNPDDQAVQAKCLVYAGLLAHYAEDLTQPLHTTIHYDGRARDDGSSPHSGIHPKVDNLLGKLKVAPATVMKDLQAEPLIDVDKAPAGKYGPDWDKPLMAAVMAELNRSHELVDKVYSLEKRLPDIDQPIAPGSDVEAFTLDRARAAGRFTAGLYLTAWKMSGKIEIPTFHRRGAPTTSRQVK